MAMKNPKKAMIIGLDAPIAKRIKDYALRGELPHINRLIKEGVYAENCLVPHPTITPPNWTTIATGAWPGTHGLTCFHVHHPGNPLDFTVQAFDTKDCVAEYIWDAAERQDKLSIIMNYPSSWPPTVKKGIQIGGTGLCVNEWRSGPRWASKISLADEQLFSLEPYPLAKVIELEKAKDWHDVPLSEEDLEAALPFVFRRTKIEVTGEKTLCLLLPKDSERGYERAVISENKSSQGLLASLRVGEWSENLISSFETVEGQKRAAFRIKLVELAPDASKLRLYFTPLCQLDGWSFPDSIAGEIKAKDGLPLPHPGEHALNLGWIGLETFLEMVEMENTWFKEAGAYLLKKHPWALFLMQAHCPDYFHHLFMNKLDPDAFPEQEERAVYEAAELRLYKSLDDMIGGLVEAAGPDTLVIITSDHGAVPYYSEFSPGKLLEKAGLTVYRKNEETGEKEIDWPRTRAIWQRSIYVYVNVKGRDPQGIVEPGEEYEKIRDQIIDLLLNYVDPKTGRRPMILALRREDARVLGLYGDRVGDVICAWGSGTAATVGGVHGGQLPTVETGIGSMKGLLILHGPGIKKGITLQRTIWLSDITPTICYLLEIPIPRQAEGAIIYQALEDPDVKMKELQTLRKNYQRALKALEGDRALTHDYSAH